LISGPKGRKLCATTDVATLSSDYRNLRHVRAGRRVGECAISSTVRSVCLCRRESGAYHPADRAACFALTGLALLQFYPSALSSRTSDVLRIARSKLIALRSQDFGKLSPLIARASTSCWC